MRYDYERLVFGYAAAAFDEDVTPAEQQAILVERAAARVDGVWSGCEIDHLPSGPNVPYCERPGFRKLMCKLDVGDHLIVWRLDRIDRSPFTLIKAIEFLVRREVTAHSVEFRSFELHLNQEFGKVFVAVWNEIIEMLNQWRREASRRATRRRNAEGLAMGRYPGYGKRRIRTRQGKLADVWDAKQISIIRELKERRDSGESMEWIARDFRRRRLRTGSGVPWAKMGKKGRLELSRLYKALAFYEGLLADGRELGDELAGTMSAPSRRGTD